MENCTSCAFQEQESLEQPCAACIAGENHYTHYTGANALERINCEILHHIIRINNFSEKMVTVDYEMGQTAKAFLEAATILEEELDRKA